MLRFSKITKASIAGFHTSANRLAITRFNLPAMSPTMTEGTIHQWKKKEGDSFAAGDVLLELETDKAQIDVEAAEDGVLAKIILPDGGKGSVNTLIALIAEEGDDISNVQVPAEENQQPAAAAAAPEEKKEPKASVISPATSPISHHDIDTSKLKKPLSPAVLSLVLKYGIKDVGTIEASGYGGRILKGDVLAHLGLIKPKPAPQPTLSIAPPRDQIVFAKTESPKAAEKEAKKEVLPSFISKRVAVDNLFSLRQSLNDQHGTYVSVNDFITKAAERALQDVTFNKTHSKKPVVVNKSQVAYSTEKYTGGQFKVFHLSEPNYDFITDSYSNGKPYVMSVSASERVYSQQQTKSADSEMLDLIDFLGGQKPKVESRRVQLTTQSATLDFSKQPKQQQQYHVDVKLDGGVPGKILNNQKATAFLDRVEYYIKNPNELVV